MTSEPETTSRYATLMHHRFTRAIIGDRLSVALVETAARRFGVPLASIALVGKTNVHFVAEFGTRLHVVPRKSSFSVHVIRSDQPLVVENLLLDARFAAHPVVLHRHVRFLAGAPLIDGEGVRFGAFCIVDRRPRHPTDADIADLVGFAARAMCRIDFLSVVSELSRDERVSGALASRAGSPYAAPTATKGSA